MRAFLISHFVYAFPILAHSIQSNSRSSFFQKQPKLFTSQKTITSCAKMMMILAILPFMIILSTGSAEEQPHSRARRFCCGGSSALDISGGKIGCVVSQNKLFINGLFNKDLNEDEQQELSMYRDGQQEFKEKVKEYLEKRWNATSADEVEQLPKPEPPKKPSFCSEKATTQFIFDGCVVQGDSVFIGNNFVRKLSPEEQQQLEEFDKKFTDYQEALSDRLRQQVAEVFGKTFAPMFDRMISSPNKLNAQEQPQEDGGANNSSSSELSEGIKKVLPEQPKTPDFCTLII